MKRWLIIAPLSALGILAGIHYFENHAAHATPLPVAGKPHIAHWLDDKPAALSFTFDDGLQCHADIAAPMLHQFGLRATFFVIPGMARQHRSDPPMHIARLRFGEGALSWDEIRGIHNLNMEIGNHSLFHNFLNRITDEHELEHQINDAADLITENVGARPVSFAFPYNEFSPLSLEVARQRHFAIRDHWTDYGGPTFTAAFADNLVEKTIHNHGWLVPMIHGIDGGFLPLASAVLRAHLAFVKAHENQIWVDTFGDVARYQLERNAATLHVEDSVPGETTLMLTGKTPPNPLPLTVILPLPLNKQSDDVDAQDTATQTEIPLTRAPDSIRITLPIGETVRVTWH